MPILNLFDLEGKKAIITGGGRGLGKGMAEGLCEAGAKVVMIGSSQSVVRSAEEFRKKGLNAIGLVGDLSDENNVSIIFNKAFNQLDKHIDILINNAGIQKRHKCDEFSLEDWDRVLQLNLNVVFMLCQLAGRKMLRQKYGKIINLASMLSYFGGVTVPAYAASKGGVVQLTKALSNEWSQQNVHVNAIAPGYMDTEMNVNLLNDKKRNMEILNRIPQKRWGTPEDLKGIAVFLASPASDYINGAIIPVDGGYLGR
ncbi:SDR family oxidoreductase [Megasphaera paucivorans]|uniref:2-deoxy-D-gluconate 3-dehydrogenase n=1 Tax=Megasphaera paucivorans TaxID=349095 RepID=A0A1G9WV49_9FIRM|nr:SDR family oxidoreductase [Megasphaera paucivorans]SDM88484.1 2-deoxy-D-gluconate 3-dehydrogenase [Megasphaera paucivorans]